MKNIVFAVALALFPLTNALAEAEIGAVESFGHLAKIVDKIQAPANTLLVMDNDDTLTMMPCPSLASPETCQYLGGPAWFSWQQSLLGSESPYRVAKNMDELLSISSLLFAMSNMVYTDPEIHPVLTRLSGAGVRLLVATARGAANVNATEQQFSQLAGAGHQAGPTLLQLIASSGLQMWPVNQAGFTSPVKPCNIPGSRPVAFQNGIYYLAGQNKGLMLSCLLTQYEYANPFSPSLPITHIVFIDDTRQNVEDVYEFFKENPRYQVKALHYTALDKHKEALTKGADKERLQRTANERWQALKGAMDAYLLDPVVK